MTNRNFLRLAAIAFAALSACFQSHADGLNFVQLRDSTSYVRVNDPDTVALSLDVYTNYTLPCAGLPAADMLKMADMLIGITGVGFDTEGYPAPSSLTDYEGGKWTPATPANSGKVGKLLDALGAQGVTRMWSEDASISPAFKDAEKLSMLAGNYVYTGGAHGLYIEHCINYSLSEKRFVQLSDIFPGIGTPQGKERYTRTLVPLLTSKAKKILSDMEVSFSLLTDAVTPTDNFVFSKDGIVLRYLPYEIGPWAAGVVEIPLSNEEIKSIVSRSI